MRIFKSTLLVFVGIVLLLEIFIVTSGKFYLNTVLINTVFKFKLGPSINEINLFSTRKINTGKPQPWPVSTSYNTNSINQHNLQFVKELQTVQLVLIKNDSLLFEYYADDESQKQLYNSFSMSKSIVGILVGCAVKNALIKSIDEPVGNYLTYYSKPSLNKITIKHLLTMSSGLNFKEDYVSPLAWPAEAYYGPDVNALTLNQSTLINEPGRIWFYKGGDTQILGMLLQKVTGKSVAAYASEMLWQPLGAEYTAYWSLDEQGMEKVSCCWYAHARDFARIGKLMLQKGYFNGKQIIDTAYAEESVKPIALPDEKGRVNSNYGFQWWHINYKNQSVFYARGIKGQYIFVLPQLNVILVRLGKLRGKKDMNDIPADLYAYLDFAMAAK